MLEEPDHPSFGELLRFYREKSVDRRAVTRLSQDHFAMRLSEKTGLIVTRNKISNWETNKTRIAVDDRGILLYILAVLHEHGGINSSDEANQLLEAGNYRSLSPAEVQQIFPQEQLGSTPPRATVEELDWEKIASPVLESKLLKVQREWQRILADAKVGPQPNWPRVLVALTHVALDRWTIFDTLHVLGWLWFWFLTWWLIAPSLRWPFNNREDAISGIAIYAGATILLPPCIGLLTSPQNNDFWKQQRLTKKWVLYLYVYQGAGIGFHLGYFIAFLLTLVAYYTHLHTTTWSEVLITLFPLIFGYIGAQLIPYNLWRAYGRLHLADGAIFFTFLILGPVWGYFFLNFYSYFLIPTVGTIMILLAATSLVALMAWRQRKTGSTLIPAYWWSLIYGSILVLYEINRGESWYNVTALAGLILVLSTLSALGRIKLTFTGILSAIVAIGLLFITLRFNLWIARGFAVLLIIIWWRWGKSLLSLTPSFWLVILIVAGCFLAIKQGFMSEILASVIIATTSLLVILWEWRR